MAFGHKLSRQRLKQLVILTVALLTAVSTATAQNRLESHRSGVDNAAVPQDLLLAGVNRSECSAPLLATWGQLPRPRIPPLPAGQRPNFIVVLIDDRGFDDIGVNHPTNADGTPSGALTPNLNRLIKGGTSFTNFYTAPLCALSRAQLLTGRDYARTGNLFNAQGFDSFALGEATMGDVMQQAGYITAHYGKWHNGHDLGYEPWWRGFNESWMPTENIHVDNLMQHNGKYVQTKGLMEQVVIDKMLGFLRDRERDNKPFFIYYAPNAMHNWLYRPDKFHILMPAPSLHLLASLLQLTSKDPLYFTPEPYLSEVASLEPTPPATLTAQAWSLLAYWDDVFGRLMDYIESSSYLHSSTYMLVTGDNGSALPRRIYDSPKDLLRRVPSRMLGHKNYPEPSLGSTATEGGVRNHLAVAGPGVKSGAVDDTLTNLADVLPTIADLAQAGSTKHMPWSGRSFATLISADGRRTAAQDQRPYFWLTTCPELEALMTVRLPVLGKNREVLKPQPLLSYRKSDGSPNLKTCIAGRYKEFKWFGNSDRVFRFADNSYVEKPCNEVNTKAARQIAANLDAAAEAWWASVAAEPHSFTKPTYQLGLYGVQVSNVEAAGIIEVKGAISINNLASFDQPQVGDRACIRVNVTRAGKYQVLAVYSAAGTVGLAAAFKVSVGTYADITSGRAPVATATLVDKSTKAKWNTKSMGALQLPRSRDQLTEVCLELASLKTLAVHTKPQDASAQSPGEPAGCRGNRSSSSSVGASSAGTSSLAHPAGAGPFKFQLANLRFVLLKKAGATGRALPPAGTADAAGLPSGIPRNVSIHVDAEPAEYQFFQPTPAMRVFESHVRAGAIAKLQQAGVLPLRAGKDSTVKNSSDSRDDTGSRVTSTLEVWQYLQHVYNWPDGQGVFQSMYMPCEVEGMDACQTPLSSIS